MGKDNTTVIYAPMSGDVVSLDEVPDPVFSGRVLGDGVAIIPADFVKKTEGSAARFTVL